MRLNLDYQRKDEVIQQQQRETPTDKRSKHDPPDQDVARYLQVNLLAQKRVKKPKNIVKGKLLLDATCAYPTDMGLLNKAREKLEKMMDILHAPFIGKQRKSFS
ncbi:MAG: hypothetical protein ACFWT6_00425 [Virgibacillus proomii]